MHPRISQSHVTLVTSFSFIILAIGIAPASGDDSGILGRLFRFGSSSSNASSSSGSTASAPSQSGTLPYGRPGGSGAPPNASNPFATAPMVSNFNGLPQTPVTTTPITDGPAARVAPRPRMTQAVTTADPLVTRVALGRSNDGSQFGMFLQVFTDGTVIDSEGVHHLRAVDLRPIVETVQSGELYRVRGHCGAPSTDFIENVQIVIYERRLGRLNAHSYSYSGNGQGCDHAVRHLHTVLENVQAKLSRQPGTTNPSGGAPAPIGSSPASTSELSSPVPTGPVPAFGPASHGQPAAPDVSPGSGAVIPLSPVDPSR